MNELNLNFTEEQRSQLKEYLETILDLYTKEEYEEYVEDIIYNSLIWMKNTNFIL